MTIPSFIIAGASKSGSTSLWMYLKAHPQICITPYRSTRFFTQEIGFADGGAEDGPLLSGRYSKGMRWYESLFNDCQEADAIGEVTLSYMSSSDSPELIFKTIPDVKLLFILRNPVDRIYSHFWEEIKSGMDLPDFNTLVKTRHPRYLRYLQISTYDQHLERFLKVFSQNQIFVFLHDDLKTNARKLLREIYLAIGVDGDFIPQEIDKKFNVAGFSRYSRIQRWMHDPRAMKISTELPLGLYKFLSRIRRQIIGINTQSVQYPPMDENLREAIHSELDKTIANIERYLNRSIPAWRKG